MNVGAGELLGRQHGYLWENMRRMLRSTRTRNRSTWMWVAIAAVAFTSVARAETGLQTARAFTHPVLEFLVRSQSQNAVTNSGAFRFAIAASGRQSRFMVQDARSGAWIAMLPVFFIGLVSPLALRSQASLQCIGLMPAAPLLPALFQRPPPVLA